MNQDHNYLTSVDIHYQLKLKKEIPHIQAMVFNECNGILGNCEVYRLTFDGYRQISKCFKNPKTLHLACESYTFYEQ